jgi:para-aminobenzoate synthetase/4-amino-4-deoxychorismate lyase
MADRPTGDRPTDDFRLIETMRWAPAAPPAAPSTGGGDVPGIRHWARHVARVTQTAAHFGFAFDAAAFRAAVTDAVRALAPDPDDADPDAAARAHKVRATVGRAGDVRVTTAPLAPPPAAPLRVTWAADVRVAPDDPFFRHKTTRRAAYERAYAAARAAGYDEALLLNTRGHVTEGTRTNLVARLDGALVTPPVACGLLGGVARAHLLTTTDAAARVLTPADVARADALYLGNAVRGWQRAVLDG